MWPNEFGPTVLSASRLPALHDWAIIGPMRYPAALLLLSLLTPALNAEPGPDARDNYHRKLTRLRNHQLTRIELADDFLVVAVGKVDRYG